MSFSSRVSLAFAFMLAVCSAGVVRAEPSGAALAPTVTPIAISIDGRPMSRSADAAVERGGVVFVAVVEIVRTFDGLLTIRKDATVASVGGHEAIFRTGQSRASVDGVERPMGHAAFVAHGDLYVPLAFFVRNLTPGVTLRTDAATGAVALRSAAPPSPVASPAATPGPTASPTGQP